MQLNVNPDEQVADEPIRHEPYTPLGMDNKEADEDDRIDLFKQTPVLKQQLDDLAKEIRRLNSVSDIPPSVLKNPEHFMHEIAGRKIAIQILKNQRKALQDKINGVLLS